jgi:hypothetical protein
MRCIGLTRLRLLQVRLRCASRRNRSLGLAGEFSLCGPRTLAGFSSHRPAFWRMAYCSGFTPFECNCKIAVEPVDLEGFEPSAFSMPLRRAPNCAMGPYFILFWFSFLPVDLEGFEPSASSVRLKRAPNCATGPLARRIFYPAAFGCVKQNVCAPRTFPHIRRSIRPVFRFAR